MLWRKALTAKPSSGLICLFGQQLSNGADSLLGDGRSIFKWMRGFRHQTALGRAASAFLVLILLWFIGWLLVGDAFLIVRWGAFAAPWLAVLTLLTGGVLALSRRFWFAALALAAALLILVPVLPRFDVRRLSAVPNASDLRVLSFNSSELNNDFDGIARVIVANRADIVFLQQVSDLHALLGHIAGLPGHYTYQAYPDRTADTVILTRFMLSGGQQIDRRSTAIVAIGACRVRLWNLHAPHGQFVVAEQSLFFERAAASLDGETLPVIAAGDLNSTEYNSVQAPLRARLADAFGEAGAGLGFTFPSPVRRFGLLGRLFRIDHVFHRGVGRAASAIVIGDNANSDHFPLLVSFEYRKLCT